ncbi:MAG: BMC domain-containing protein [Clostridia bacterium]|nr:BMC domain-containing protein [Clostridia bacterium]
MENLALGFIEISGVVAALDALDIMTKSANVSFVTWERKLGGRLVTIVVEGQVAAVNAAVENAVKGAIKKPNAYLVIAAPHSETRRIVEISASRLKKDEQKSEVVEAPSAKTTAKKSSVSK